MAHGHDAFEEGRAGRGWSCPWRLVIGWYLKPGQQSSWRRPTDNPGKKSFFAQFHHSDESNHYAASGFHFCKTNTLDPFANNYQRKFIAAISTVRVWHSAHSARCCEMKLKITAHNTWIVNNTLFISILIIPDCSLYSCTHNLLVVHAFVWCHAILRANYLSLHYDRNSIAAGMLWISQLPYHRASIDLWIKQIGLSRANNRVSMHNKCNQSRTGYERLYIIDV